MTAKGKKKPENRGAGAPVFGETLGFREVLYNEYLPENNLKPNGHYHAIYLNDPARTAPNKRKIVIRQPVA